MSYLRPLLYFALMLATAFATRPTIQVQSSPLTAPVAGIASNLIQGVAGVGLDVSGSGVPCLACFGMPAGMAVVPPSYQIGPVPGTPVVYYSILQTVNLSGTGTVTINLVQSSTGTVVQSITSPVTLAANSANLVSVFTEIPDSNGYIGPETLIFTTTVGGSTVQGKAYLVVKSQ